MENFEDTQNFNMYALPHVLPHDAGKTFSDCEGNESVVKGW